MDTNILAVIIQEGSRLASELLRGRTPSKLPPSEDSLQKFIKDSDLRLAPYTQISPTPPVEEPAPQTASIQVVNVVPPVENKAKEIATGCIPCAMGHLGTCSGILNESVRFAKTDAGVGSPEVIDRVNMCLDELNAMERVDLRPEMTTQLTGWEKDLAERALAESRSIRHTLEGMKDVKELEKVAATTQTSRKEIGRTWFQNKLVNMNDTDKEEIKRRVLAKIEELAAAEEGE